MKNEPLVSIIIVNWNGEEVFRECLKSLAKIKYKNYELIIVDNNSVDGSENFYKKIKLNNTRTIILKNTQNLGFAPANNQGFKKSKGEFLLLLNNDTKVAKDFLNIMVEKMKSDNSIGALQPKIFLMDKKNYLDNAGSFMTRTGFLQHWGFMRKDSREFDQEREVFSAKGACLLIRTDVVKKTKLFDDRFVSYFEETDFCWKVWLVGKRVIYYPKTFIFHKVGFTSKKQNQIEVNFNSFKNRICSLLKNLDDRNLILIGGVHLILILGLSIYYLVKLEFYKSWMIIKSILWNLINIEETIREREFIKKIRKITDDEIFSKLMINMSFNEMFTHFGRVEANFKKNG